VLKGSTTYISNRKKIITNNNSTKELAVIGSGDVLSGIISSLVGKNKLNCFDASCAGVWLHSEIGKKSGIGLIAEDLLKELKPVLKKLYGKFIKQRNRKKS
jgi:NAD(P)H-hydrate repair Nnr-like enzyme with NAD(P)H-hydrate dehydratase domain